MPEPEAPASAPPPLNEALGWTGFRVDDMNGSRVARVEGIYVDFEDREPVWLIVKLGRFGKITAVPYAECAGGPGRIWVAHGRKVVRDAPPVSAGQPLTGEYEVALCEHYFIQPERGRYAQVRRRPADAVTAVPVTEPPSG
jgi:PRC-barrel domain